ncbi:MAG TPA: thiamine phosphate synthase [Gemmatimonadales bacterium]|nr:thiamine phosphate synthase [Gemmatimonadales bacterium]
MAANLVAPPAGSLAAALRLMLVTDDRLVAGRDLVELCVAAAHGGVTSVQLRLKLATAREQVALARALGARLAPLDVPLLVNDRPDVALAAEAWGVHLGPDDLPLPPAREVARRAGAEGFVIGASVGSEPEAAQNAGADYWGIGPWHATTTKDDAGAALGAEGFAHLARLGAGRPCIAIGGIRPEDAPAVLAAGGVGVAVVSGIVAAPDPAAAARRYRERLERGEG